MQPTPLVATKVRALASLLALFVIALTNAPMAPTVWIAATDYGTHKGTRANPLDGSTPEKLSSILIALPPYSTIHLFTNSVYRCTGNFDIRDGWKIRGHGATVVLTMALGLQMSLYANGGAEVSDLIVDENWQSFNFPASTRTFAVNLRGNNNTIRNVRAINGYGNRASLLESFSLCIAPRVGPNGFENGTNNLIEGCSVTDYRGDYGIGISILVGGKIRNCAVTNFHGTAPFGLWRNVVYENNVSVGCTGGYYTDTGTVTNVMIRNCRMIGTKGFAVHVNPVLSDPEFAGEAFVRNVTVENCLIDCQNIGVAISGVLGPGTQYDFTIRKNTFTGPTEAAAIIAYYVNGLTVEDNLVNGGLFSVLNSPDHPSFNVTSRRNYRLPAPPGMEDAQ